MTDRQTDTGRQAGRQADMTIRTNLPLHQEPNFIELSTFHLGILLSTFHLGIHGTTIESVASSIPQSSSGSTTELLTLYYLGTKALMDGHMDLLGRRQTPSRITPSYISIKSTNQMPCRSLLEVFLHSSRRANSSDLSSI